MDTPKPRARRRASGYARLSAGYFLYFAAFGLYIPYFPAYLRDRGLDAAAIGWFVALGPLTRIVVPPLVGLLADRLRGPRFWGALTAWGAAAGLALVGAGGGAAVLLAGTLLFSTFTAPTIPLLDAGAVRGGAGTAWRFGSIRLWGSLGYLLTSFGLGYFYPQMPAAAIIFALVASHALFAAYLTLPAPDEDVPTARLAWGDVRLLSADPRLWLLFVTLFLNRVASAPFNAFYTIFLQDLGLSGRVVALTWGIAITVEVVAMWWADRALRRFGTAAVLAAGVGLEAARWFAYAHFRTESAMLLLAPFHGLGFALFYVAGVRAVAELVPAGMRSMGQGASAAAAGVGQAAGIVCAGYVYESAGPGVMFAAGGAFGVLAFVFALLLGRATARPSEEAA